MLFGLPPFYNEDIQEMYNMIKHTEVKFTKKIKVSDDTKDLIKLLLDKNPSQRLGTGGFEEIKKHPFFSLIDFEEILTKKLPTPLKPQLKDNQDVTFFDEEFTGEAGGETYIDKNNMDLIKQNQYKFKQFNQ